MAALAKLDSEGDEIFEKIRVADIMKNQRHLELLAKIDGTKLDAPTYIVHDLELTIEQKNKKMRNKRQSYVILLFIIILKYKLIS